MRRLVFAALGVLLALAVANNSAMAAPAPPPAAPLGAIIDATSSQTGIGAFSSGATVYDGDLLQTGSGDTLRARLGTGQVFVQSSSSIRVHAFLDGYSADLAAGTVTASSGEGQTFRIFADGATIRPIDTKSATVQVTRISNKELLVTSLRGRLEISMADETRTFDPGTSYRLTVDDTDSSGSGPQPQLPSPTAKNHFLWIAIPLIIAGTAVIIWRAVITPSGF